MSTWWKWYEYYIASDTLRKTLSIGQTNKGTPDEDTKQEKETRNLTDDETVATLREKLDHIETLLEDKFQELSVLIKSQNNA